MKEINTYSEDMIAQRVCFEWHYSRQGSLESDWFKLFLGQVLEKIDNAYERYPQTRAMLYMRWFSEIRRQGSLDSHITFETSYETPPLDLDIYNAIPRIKENLVCTRNHRMRRRAAI